MNEQKKKRGLALHNLERRKQIASMGGRASQATGKAHQWTQETARAAGRKGGATISKDRLHMAAIGRLGGAAMHRNKAKLSAISSPEKYQP